MEKSLVHALHLGTFKPLCGATTEGGCLTTDCRTWVTCPDCIKRLDAGETIR